MLGVLRDINGKGWRKGERRKRDSRERESRRVVEREQQRERERCRELRQLQASGKSNMLAIFCLAQPNSLQAAKNSANCKTRSLSLPLPPLLLSSLLSLCLALLLLHSFHFPISSPFPLSFPFYFPAAA